MKHEGKAVDEENSKTQSTVPQETDSSQSENASTEAQKSNTNKKEPPKLSVSAGLSALLTRLNTSFAFTSYQSGLLYLVGRNAKGGINIHHTALAKPMGLCKLSDKGLLVGGGFQIYRFANALKSGQIANERFDNLLIPRTVHLTGRLDAHDLGVLENGNTIFVNTRFNCLATLSESLSFETYWKPDFISKIVDEDRCHLNGLAMENGKPKYVTAISRSDTIDGWRDRRSDGGIVIDVENNEIVTTGLSMPHSPRIHNGQLWVLNSGTGELGVVDLRKSPEKSFTPKVFCPGFLRGLDFAGNFAFVGLSKPRYERFEGLELDNKLQDADSEPWCGIQVINLDTFTCAEWLRIDGQIGELYDVEMLPSTICPMAVANNTKEAAQTINF